MTALGSLLAMLAGLLRDLAQLAASPSGLIGPMATALAATVLAGAMLAVAIGPIRPVGPAASWARSRSSAASMASRLPSAVIAIASATRPTPRPRTELLSAYAVGRQLRDSGQQPARSYANSATADSSRSTSASSL